MKKKNLILGLITISAFANAQTWGGSGNQTGNAYRTGNVGIGTTSPANQLDVSTSATDGGIKVTQTGSGGSWLFMNNATSNGRNWGLLSSGGANNIGGGHFAIYDLSASPAKPRIFIDGTSGATGIGTTLPYSNSKLHVLNDGTSGDLWGISVETNGIPTTFNPSGTRAIYARAENAQYNTACYLQSGGNSNALQNIGIIVGMAASSNPTNDWAAYFMGRTFCTSGTWSSSDRKLKDNIKPLEASLEKIMQLKPSSYTYKTSEYKTMNLPDGEQMGLIAQEVEQVFPSAVAEVKSITQKDASGKETFSTVEHKSVNYTSLIPVLISGIQEQQKIILSQQKQLDEQKELINNLVQKSSATTGVNDLSVEAGFQMSQNEPNPFTHETVVKYTLPQTISNAFMAVYDLTGKQITTFPITEKGSSSLTITSEKLAAGIYIYSIVADGKVLDSKRMIVANK